MIGGPWPQEVQVVQWCLGVDLGTSFSAGAISVEGRVDNLEVDGDRRIPSTILLNEQGVLVAGRAAHRSMGAYPERVERNPKRYVGKGTMLLAGVPVEVGDALAALLRLFVDEGRARFDGVPPSCLVLTCPVAWDEARRSVLRAAGEAVAPQARIALVEEPVASALHYASVHRVGGGKRVVVYDLGGGTFDTAIVEADGDGFRVVGEPGGDDAIGGEEFDVRVYDHFGRQVEQANAEWFAEVGRNPDRRYLAAAANLLEEARVAKETLSTFDTASQYISGADTDVSITRDELDEMVKADVLRTADLVGETLERAKVAPADLAGIFLTGGASRMPLVHRILRERHGDLVRTSDDPKTVVALGAARLAWNLREDDPHAPILRDVLEVRATDEWIYALCADGDKGHLLRRLDPALDGVDREVRFGRIEDWGVSADGLVVVAQDPGGLWLHTLTPELTIRSGQRFQGRSGARVVVRGATGWVFLDGRVRPVDHMNGLPYGEIGRLSVVEVNLRQFFVQEAPEIPLGERAQWFVNEGIGLRRLLDQDAPTGNEPASVVGSEGCAVILGRFTGRRSLTGVYRSFTPWQALCMIAPGGRVSVIERHRPNWLQQILLYDGKWFISTNVGLEIDAAPGPVRVLVTRMRGGALRWVPAGRRMYALGMDTVVPARGWAVLLYEEGDGGLRLLHHEPRGCLLGHLTSRLRAERPRILIDGETLWLAASGEAGDSRILHVTPAGVEQVHRATGWIEPVAKIPGGLLCLHRPDAEPGPGQALPANLVRLAL